MSRRSGLATSDADICRAIVRKHARTFTLASHLLPAEKRRGAYAIYATCRTADDIVDLGAGDRATMHLSRFRTEAVEAQQWPSTQPVLRELAWSIRRFGVATSALSELFAGVERDLDHSPFASWAELEAYCQGVAGSVGEMVSAVFGVREGVAPTTVVQHARTLGVAMQLTNILRDVGEDARRQRCYLPVDELARHGLTRDQVLRFDLQNRWDAWREFMACQVDRARSLYREATLGIAGLEPDSIPCALACAGGYAEILRAIERHDYDTISARVSTPRFTQLRVAWQSWRLRKPALATTVAPETGPRPQMHHAAR